MFEEILSNIETIGNVSVVVAYGILALIHWRLRAIDSRLRSTARRHQLRTHRGLIGDIAEGFIDGIAVHIRYISTQRKPQKGVPWGGPPLASCRVSLSLPSPLLAGLRLSSMSITQTVLQGLGSQDIEINDHRVDPELRIRADNEAGAQLLLSDPAVRAALRRAVAANTDTLEVTPDEIQLIRRGINVPDADVVLAIALELAKALQDASSSVWDALAEQLQLTAERASASGAVLCGSRRGVPLRIRISHDEDGPSTRISADFKRPLPGGMRIRSRRPETASPSTGNPILDMKLELSTTDLDAARSILADTALTGPLLELLERAPTLRILPDGIKLALNDWAPEELEALVETMAELAASFESARAPRETDSIRGRHGLSTT